MKRKFLLALVPAAFIAANAPAATVELVDVTATSINCGFSPTCNLQVSNVVSPITLPGTIGSGFLQSRVFVGEAGSIGPGIYGYEYRLDLTGLVATNASTCFTNWVRCFTNRMALTNTVVTCRTNPVGGSNLLSCVTNITPATNVVVCLTNTFPPRTVVNCVTNAAGAVTCFTNVFAGTNVVICLTNRVAARTNIVCQTNHLGGSNVVVCVTNRVRAFTNVVTCYTNLIPCPGATPCIDTIRVRFGPIYRGLNFGTNPATSAQAYLVTTGGLGTIEPVFATQSGSDVVFHFGDPVCPGESSVFFGLLSTTPPTNFTATVLLTSGSNVTATALGPIGAVARIPCDFTALSNALASLGVSDIVAPNNNARRGRLGALTHMLEAAQDAAEEGDLEDVLEAITAIQKKSTSDHHGWLTPSAARRLEPILDELLTCLGNSSGNGRDDGDEDHEDDDDDDDDDGGSHGNSPNGNGRHGNAGHGQKNGHGN